MKPSGNYLAPPEEIIHESGTAPDRLQPFNEEAEEALLGSILIEPDWMALLSDRLKPEDFYIQRHQWIFESLLRLHRAGNKIDLLILNDDLAKCKRLDEVGGSAFLTSLINATPTSVHAEYYANIVLQKADRRRLIDAAGKMARLAFDETVAEPAAEAEKILQEAITGRGVDSIVPAGEIMNVTLDHLETIYQHKGLSGIPTGLKTLDAKLGGLQRSDLIIVAGRPGMGKTALITQIVLNASSLRKRCLIFSLEMSKLQLGERMVSIKSGVQVHHLRTGQFADLGWKSIMSAADEIAKLPFSVDDTGDITPRAIRSRAIKEWAKNGLDLIVIDYLQITGRDDDTRRNSNMHQDMAEASRQFKALAKKLNIPVIVLSQLNREVERRGDKRPVLSDLRESGSIEENADVVLMLYRDGYYNPETEFPNVAEIIIAKHRSGPTGTITVYFNPELTKFTDLEVRTQSLAY
ncbi:MAG: replicative DNA helicase [Chloroflexota bacterium]|nr:MAG: replicative DNA helicase [Chloroflexota bacterium]